MVSAFARSSAAHINFILIILILNAELAYWKQNPSFWHYYLQEWPHETPSEILENKSRKPRLGHEYCCCLESLSTCQKTGKDRLAVRRNILQTGRGGWKHSSAVHFLVNGVLSFDWFYSNHFVRVFVIWVHICPVTLKHTDNSYSMSFKESCPFLFWWCIVNFFPVLS